MTDPPPDICSEIISARDAGHVTCAIYTGDDILSRGQRLGTLGFRNLKEPNWTEASPERALQLLAWCLHRDLAYDSQIMPHNQALQMAGAFLERLPEGCRLLTNTGSLLSSRQAKRTSWSWSPITHSTFDTGIIAQKDRGVVGVLWFEDED